MSEVVILYTTWPDAETAQACGAAAVEARLAACVNILAPMRSIYRWQGKVEQAQETPMLLKTTLARAEALKDFIAARHPYDTPAILPLTVADTGAAQPFLDWVRAETAILAEEDAKQANNSESSPL